MLSVNLTLQGQPVLVVGGGCVGQRKAAVAIGAGATVTLVDPRSNGVWPAGVLHICQEFEPSHLDGIRLAFACATPPVNVAVVAAAKNCGVWVCSASDPESGDFVLPSVARRGGLTFAVSTGGASPGLSKRIAAELLDQFDDSYAEWVRVLGEVRAVVRSTVADPAERQRWLAGFADPIWLERIRAVGGEVARAGMLEQLAERPE